MTLNAYILSSRTLNVYVPCPTSCEGDRHYRGICPNTKIAIDAASNYFIW